uniref:Poly [ADP-ribose] polymerase n=2 Tax=Solanum lycopersicum TaxID=4081 RepID=A0A3Q7G9F9_SOLLC
MMSKTAIVSGNIKDGKLKLRNEVLPLGRWPDHAQLLYQNRHNFKESGKPLSFKMYKDGSWMDFEKHAMDVLISAFVSGKAIIEVETEAGFKLLIDFYRMFGIDLDTGNELPISWIDVNGNNFIPKIFIDDSENENPMIEKRGTEVGSSSQLVIANPTESAPPKWARTRSMREEEYAYQTVKGYLLSSRSGVTITGIHQCMISGVREQVFKDNVEMLTRTRGNPKVVLAWYGTSSKNVDTIMHHGFELTRLEQGHRGIGIYLSPLESPQISEMMSDVDENGEKHMILCRVILGNPEKVELGSQQLFSSNLDNFDTGVDDLNNPKLYVVWYHNMKTHILPECIVSYKLDRHMPGQQNCGAHTEDRWCRLLFKLPNLLPLTKKLELKSLHNSYEVGKEVAHRHFISDIEAIVQDDQLMRSIITEFLPEMRFCQTCWDKKGIIVS